MKAESLLKNINFKSDLSKNPRPEKGEGCGYVLKISNADNDILKYLKDNGVIIKEAVWK